MKILYLITKSNWGGAQRYVYDLATAFKGKGYDVVVACGGEGELVTKLNEAQVQVRKIGSLIRDISFVKELKSFRETYLLIHKEKPEILHLNSSKAAGIGALCGYILGVPHIIYTVHGAPFREDRNNLYKTIMYFLTWVTCLMCHTVITVSKKDEWDITRMPFLSKKVCTIYNGIPFLDVPPQRTSPKNKMTHIVSIGDLTNNKGYMYALEAVDLLVKKGFSLHYTIEGEGEDREKMEAFIKERNLKEVVTLLGRTLTTKDNLHEYDIFLLASVKEGLPYVLLEAGRASMPVVTTITGGIPEIIIHEKTGLLVPVKNAQSLASELERMITSKGLATELSQNLRAHVVSTFSHSKMIAQTAKIYGTV